jgi:nicotinamidase/pyrazinamidase
MKTAFLDVDTQFDFLYPTGALYVPGAERIVPALAHLTRRAAAEGIPVICTADAHAENDVEFRTWPPHCIAGTLGQHKAEATLLPRRVVVPNGPCDFALEGAQQIIVEKQTVDVFQAPNLRRVIEAVGADRFVVYGVVTEICVLYAVRGLLQMGKQVEIVTSAIKALDAAASETTLRELQAAGAQVTESG